MSFCIELSAGGVFDLSLNLRETLYDKTNNEKVKI